MTARIPIASNAMLSATTSSQRTTATGSQGHIGQAPKYGEEVTMAPVGIRRGRDELFAEMQTVGSTASDEAVREWLAALSPAERNDVDGLIRETQEWFAAFSEAVSATFR